MELVVEIVADGRDSTDVVFDVEPTATFGDLADSVGFLARTRHAGTFTVARTGVTPRRDDRVGDVEVRSGDRLLMVDSVNAVFSTTPHAFGATLVVTGLDGTGSGGETEYQLRYGNNRVGRDPDNDVVIKDAQVSRHHARIQVSDVISVVDLGSKNGVVVGDEAVITPTLLRPGQVARIGDLELTIRNHHRSVVDVEVRNRVDFNRPPRIHRPYAGMELVLPAPPDKPSKQRIPMISAAIPVAVGIVMYYLIGFIGAIFMLLSPVLLIGSYIESRRSGRFDFKDAVAEHREIVAERVDALQEAQIEETAARFGEVPAGSQLHGLVRNLSDRLWERATDDADFLRLRVGTASLPSRSSVRVADGGWRELRRDLELLPETYRMLSDVPLAVDLPDLGGVGLAGPIASARSLARAMVLQAATLHSPTDLCVVGLVGEDGLNDWEWLKWLPHARSHGSVLASTSHHALALVKTLIAGSGDDGAAAESGRIGSPALVVIDESCPIDRRRLTPLLETAGVTSNIYFLWVTSARHRLPKACGAVVEIASDALTAAVSWRAGGDVVEPVRWEGLALADATAAARDLTPIVDMTSRLADDTEIPSRISFADLHGGPRVLDDPAAVLELWSPGQGKRDRQGLRAVIGQQSGAPLVVDLRHDGPHALVAGTTGAGKSELLQTMVAGLATMHSPEEVTFLLVDYKGGAAFKECVDLPHTVGLVTDLDRNEVRRALVSLNAELHHRERLLQRADAKDLVEMEAKGHPDTPPSLVIVVDEFAALAKEVPEFVEGVVDVALRGRSLGLHLVLATQRPAGVITGQIRANTNLRIALRMSDADESDDVIGSSIAAAIERRLPGRAVARIGPRELVSFQSGYVGGRTSAVEQEAPVRVRLFGFDHDTAVEQRSTIVVAADQPSDLQRLVANHRRAHRSIGGVAPRRPWLPSLAGSYELGRLPVSADDGAITIGVVDRPGQQLQTVAHFRPDADGGMLVYGAGGSGKTVLLRTVAASIGLTAEKSGYPVEVHALDFAGRGLDVLADLPHVGTVIAGDDGERITRLLRTLRERIDQRAVDFAAVRAQSLPEFRRLSPIGATTPRVFVLLDSYSGFQSAYDRVEAGRWLDLFSRLVVDGRQVGVHFVVTADRRSSVPMAVSTAFQRRVVLRLASDEEYANAGEPAGILTPNSPPGRGIVEGAELQIAVLSGSSNRERQADALGQLGDRLRSKDISTADAVGVLPTEIRRSALTASRTDSPSRLWVAVGDADLGPRAVPIDLGGILISGPPRSGRTTALASIAQAAAEAGVALVHVHTRPTPLAHAPFWDYCAHGPTAGAEFVRSLLDDPRRLQQRLMVVVDDLTEMCDTEFDLALSELARLGRERPVTIVAAVDNLVARRQYSGVVPDLRKDQIGLLLQPDIDSDGDLLGVSLPRRSTRVWPEGRGYYAERGAVELWQVALPDPW